MGEYVTKRIVVDAVQPFLEQGDVPDWFAEAVRRGFIRMRKTQIEVMVDTDDSANGHYQAIQHTDWVVRIGLGFEKLIVMDTDVFDEWFEPSD